VFFSKAFPAVDWILVLSFFVKVVPHNKLSDWTAIIYVTSFLLSFCLHVVGMSRSRCIRGQHQVQWRGSMIAYLSTVLRMLSAAALLLCLDYGVHSVAVLPPFLLALALASALSWRTLGTGWAREMLGYNWGHFEQELKLAFNLSASVVSMAFAGLTGRVLGGGYKQLQGRRHGFMAVAPECLLFYGLVLGLLLMLHCTVPSHVMFYITRRKVAKVYKPILAYLALLLLVLASVVAAEDMLRINVFSVCFGVVVAAFAYLFWRKYQSLGGENAAASMADEEEGQRQHQLAAAAARRERDATLSQYILKGYITPLFSLVMATHSKHSIIDDDGATAGTLSWMFKCLLFLGLCSILINAVRILVSAEMQDWDREDRCAISCATYATYRAMATTCFCFVLVLALKFDELKHILAS